MDEAAYLPIVRQVGLVLLVILLLDLADWLAFGHPVLGVGGYLGRGPVELPVLVIGAACVLVYALVLRIFTSTARSARPDYAVVLKSARVVLPILSALVLSNLTFVLLFQLYLYLGRSWLILQIDTKLILYVCLTLGVIYWVLYQFNKPPVRSALRAWFGGYPKPRAVWRRCVSWTLVMLVFFISYWIVAKLLPANFSRI
jgi:hypothetical protein